MANYDEETNPVLKKMIDFITTNTSKFQFTKEEVLDEEWVQQEEELLNQGKFEEVTAIYRQYIDTHNIKLAICVPTYDGNVRVEVLSNLMLGFKPEHRMFYIIGHNIDAQRNELINTVLEWQECTHVLFIDGDTAIPPQGIMRLIMREKDIVGGFYMQNQPPFATMAIKRPINPKTGEKMVNFFPNIFERFYYSLLKVDATGAGCLLVKREVFETMERPYFKSVLLEDAKFGKVMGEDVYFFDKATALGYDVFVDISVKCEHITGRNSFPYHFIRHNLERGESSIDQLRKFNNSAMLYYGGFDVGVFNKLMNDERLRQEEKARKEKEKEAVKELPAELTETIEPKKQKNKKSKSKVLSNDETTSKNKESA